MRMKQRRREKRRSPRLSELYPKLCLFGLRMRKSTSALLGGKDVAETSHLWRFPKSWNPYNVKPFSTDISVTVAQIQKIQKTRCIFFRILLLEGPSPPSQLVPNPFNWFPSTVFCRYRGNSHSNKKN